MFCSDFITEGAIIKQNIITPNNYQHPPGTNSSKMKVDEEKLVYFVVAKKWRMVGPGVFRK